MAFQVFNPTQIQNFPWEKRLRKKKAWIYELPFDEEIEPTDSSKLVWLRTAYSEYASAAAFTNISQALLACAAPLDMVSCVNDFAIDELIHTEVAILVANKLGCNYALEIDYNKLVRPASKENASILKACELIVRSCCVGETLTVPILKKSAELAKSELISKTLTKIRKDEISHAQFGWYFLDWAEPFLNQSDLNFLGNVTRETIDSFQIVLNAECSESGYGVLACQDFDPIFLSAVQKNVILPLKERGIIVEID
ncbi:MAG TPA: hypothetical protein PK079_03295 [Leptospiraceae bacterium]|nr:hypothetical protein [Leptospiraceae bacterium]HMW03779.1 hypothetical protein [Leptospiraceae bacterium]HMX34261.1 hypothetical protein [Leptospiraceae bacterium]HMY29759.1 hypothetical protein [Leptospiraceae bacterium]HMZ62842.1 hypothetical protein [Leptospiraceae bacterium]